MSTRGAICSCWGSSSTKCWRASRRFAAIRCFRWRGRSCRTNRPRWAGRRASSASTASFTGPCASGSMSATRRPSRLRRICARRCSVTDTGEVSHVRPMTRLVVLPFRVLRPDPSIDFLAFSLRGCDQLRALGTSLARRPIDGRRLALCRRHAGHSGAGRRAGCGCRACWARCSAAANRCASAPSSFRPHRGRSCGR